MTDEQAEKDEIVAINRSATTSSWIDATPREYNERLRNAIEDTKIIGDRKIRLTADSPIIWNLQRAVEHLNATSRMAKEVDAGMAAKIAGMSENLRREIGQLLWK